MPVMGGRVGWSCASSGIASRARVIIERTQRIRSPQDSATNLDFNLRISSRRAQSALFEALVGGLVVGGGVEIVGEAGHVGNFVAESV
jgi:hypothetical protein